MCFHSREAQIEERGDFLVGPPLGEQLQDLLFPVGQQMVRVGQAALFQSADVVLNQYGGDSWAEERLAGRNRSNGRNQVFIRGALQKIRASTGRKGAHDVRLVTMHA